MTTFIIKNFYKGEDKEYSSLKELLPDLYSTVIAVAALYSEREDLLKAATRPGAFLEDDRDDLFNKNMSEDAKVSTIYTAILDHVYQALKLEWYDPEGFVDCMKMIDIEMEVRDV